VQVGATQQFGVVANIPHPIQDTGKLRHRQDAQTRRLRLV
jgi:hypothetical protein